MGHRRRARAFPRMENGTFADMEGIEEGEGGAGGENEEAGA